MIRLNRIALLLSPVLLASCTTTTGRPYPLAVRETTRFLKSKSPHQLFYLKKRRKEDGVEFSFCDGSKRDKAAVVFPLRVTIDLMPKKEGALSELKLRAYKQGLFLSGRKPEFEDKWESAILSHLRSVQPDS
ncbi:hypothetical protein N9195_01340 [bacterium]|nr:hypothetical protein [bacterium]